PKPPESDTPVGGAAKSSTGPRRPRAVLFGALALVFVTTGVTLVRRNATGPPPASASGRQGREAESTRATLPSPAAPTATTSPGPSEVSPPEIVSTREPPPVAPTVRATPRSSGPAPSKPKYSVK